MAAINAAGTYFGQFSVQGRAILGINFDLTNYQGYSYITTSQAYYLCSPGGSSRLYKNVGHARSIMTFNGCGARVDGQTVPLAGYTAFANYKIADNGRPAGPAGNVIYSGAPTKEQALAYCASGASCAVYVDETSVSTRNGPQKSVGSKIVNCEPTPFTASYQETVATGGSMYIGHEISVSYSAGAPGAYQFELAYSLSFGKEWNWSTSVTKTYTVTAHQHRWVQLMVTTPMEDVKGDFDINLPSGSPYKPKRFALKNAVMSHPDPNANPVFVQQGGTLTSAEIQ